MKLRSRTAVVVGLSLAACGKPSLPPPAPPTPVPVQPPPSWVEQTLAHLTLRQKVAQMIVPRISGSYLAEPSDQFDALKEWVVDEGVGGLIVTIGPPYELAAKLNRLQELASVPLLISADMEHGPGQILNAGIILPYGIDNGTATNFPPLMGLGATGDESLAYDLGRITGIEGRAVGINMVYAPVVDVNNNPANPIINTRSYGADPSAVARMAAAQIRGLQEHGMLATAKHFPGHGDTGTDSHINLPVITVNLARADSVELPPYRAAIGVGVAAIMSAHIAFPALTGDSVPATLNPTILTGLLRDQLAFRGLIVTDAMDMGAIVKRYGNTDAPLRAVKAGADLLLQVAPTDVALVINTIVTSVRNGDIPETRIDQSVRRILAAKQRLGLERRRTVDLDSIPLLVGTRDHEAVALAAAARSITAVRDRAALLPLPAQQRVLSIVYSDDVDPFAGRVFQRELAAGLPDVHPAFLSRDFDSPQLAALRAAADHADLVLFAPFIRVGAYKGGLAIPPELADFINELAAAHPTVVVSFGNPYVLSQLPPVSTYVTAWGQWREPQEAAAHALLGQAPMTGTLPIPIPPDVPIGEGLHVGQVWAPATRMLPPSPAPVLGGMTLASPGDVGMSAAALNQVDRIIRSALAHGAAPGAAVAIGRHGYLVKIRGYGHLDPKPGFAAVTDSTLYDLASLTKVIGTTSAIMMLVDDGAVNLDARVSEYIPEWQGSPQKEAVTVRNLLLHNSGLPAFGPLYQHLRGRLPYRDSIAAMPLAYAPGTRTVYSDFGAMMLGFIVEQVTGVPLDVFLQRRLFGPLGMNDTGFRPATPAEIFTARALGPRRTRGIMARIAPTEVDTLFRHVHVWGSVHDENAFAMGGVAGHAGLFSSARDLAVFADLLLNKGSYDGRQYIRPETVEEFTRRQSETSTRALGWDTPGPSSSAGDYFSARSFGHTGFTGTSIWIDPERDVFVVLLTNRVDPTRENQKHIALRRAVADAVALAIRDQPVQKRADASGGDPR